MWLTTWQEDRKQSSIDKRSWAEQNHANLSQPTTKTNKFYRIKNFQIQTIRSTESKMDIETNLNQILQVLRNSGLHFSSQETPYSLYITIRKKFKQNREAPAHCVPILSSNHGDKECKLFENSLERAKSEFNQEISEHEKTVKEKVEIGRQLASQEKLNETLRQESEVLRADIGALESDLKALKRINKIKEKELHDINKENKTLRENSEASNRDLKIVTAQVKKYEKEELKNSKVRQEK